MDTDMSNILQDTSWIYTDDLDIQISFLVGPTSIQTFRPQPFGPNLFVDGGIESSVNGRR